MAQYPAGVFDVAKQFVFSGLGYTFTDDERRAIRPFFSNLDRRVYFMHAIPANVGATLLAMFSRLKDPRGLRGVWVSQFLPQFLATQLPEVETDFGGDEAKFLRVKKITNLGAFLECSREARGLFERFLDAVAVDPDYLRTFAESKKTRKFLDTWLDKYGHNSIARMGSVWLCFEGISLLAAKSIEWCRPGAGYIELSTRYVDMSAGGCYPIEHEFEVGWKVDPQRIRQSNDLAFQLYQELAGDSFDGPFPTFLRNRFGHFYDGAPKDLDAGVIGETCDVLGNLLPASALTSVGVNVSGEAFPMLLKHLLLDDTPENLALVDLILEEAPRVGAHQFARHYQPTAWDRAHWEYLRHAGFGSMGWQQGSFAVPIVAYNARQLEEPLVAMLRERGITSMHDLSEIPRDEHDKLPADFEAVSLLFKGVMSFRGWRDLHRQGFCTHHRTVLSTTPGFYRYDKPAPEALQHAFEQIHTANRAVEDMLRDLHVSPLLCQYPLSLGNRIGFTVAGNLRQWEFCNWQRTDFSVNHEVRQVFLSIEVALRNLFLWWSTLSRADTEPAYVFARGSKAFPLSVSPASAPAASSSPG